MVRKILKPMLLQETMKPSWSKDYIYELKYDGIRALIYVDKKSLKIYTRNSNDVTNIYPELLAIKGITNNHEVIFDGEIIAFKDNLPSFSELQKRSHLKNTCEITKRKEEIPVLFMAFDCLYDNKYLLDKPLTYRKKVLNTFFDNKVFMKVNTYEDGASLFNQVKALGMEGIVAKKKTSLYIPNKRVSFWLKIKNFQKSYFLIHGYQKLKQKYRLFLGEYQEQSLYFVGYVSIKASDPLITKLTKTKKVKNQFVNFNHEGNFIEPLNKIEVYYQERTLNGHLRSPFLR